MEAGSRISKAAALGLVVALTTVACASDATPEREPNSAPTFERSVVEEGSQPRWMKVSCERPPREIVISARGLYGERSPDVIVTPQPPNLIGTFRSTTHSGPWDYTQRVPLVLYGPGHILPRGSVTGTGESTVADLAPTYAELVRMSWPEDRSGRALLDAIKPNPAPPKLIVTVVWDGGGWNVLERWPKAWPNLKRLMKRGTSYTEAIVGSSPSVTPAIHATIGTGGFPSEHGAIDIWYRDKGEIAPAFDGYDPSLLRLTTFPDLYDPTTDNRAKIAMVAESEWHLGMLGQGAGHPGGDRDIAIMSTNETGLKTNERLYKLPSYVRNVPGLEDDARAVDVADGTADGTWMDSVNLDSPLAFRQSPMWTLYQRRLLQRLITRGDFGRDGTTDVIYTNFKQLDLVGHAFNMVSPHTRSTLRHTDRVLGELVDVLDRAVGPDDYVLAVTADHGQGPAPEATGGWPISMGEFRRDIEEGFPGRGMVDRSRPTGIWLDPEEMRRRDVVPGDVANLVLDYRVRHNRADVEIPDGYDLRPGDRLFNAAWPAARTDDVLACAREARA